MQSTQERLAFALRSARKRENLTQVELSERLNMSIRTIQDIENQKNNPKFETIVLICKELNISFDAILYPDLPITTVSKTVIDFFKDKSESESQKYIALCKQAQTINPQQTMKSLL